MKNKQERTLLAAKLARQLKRFSNLHHTSLTNLSIDNFHCFPRKVPRGERVGNKCNRVKGHGKLYADDVIKK